MYSNFNSHFQAQKPKDITEVAESVEYNEDLDEAILRSAWAKAFIQSPALNHPQGGQVKRDLFIFLVSCCLLNKIRDSPKKVKNDGRVKTENNNDVKSEKLLEIIRSRFFADDKLYQTTLPLKDINNAVEKIFKIYYEDGVGGNVGVLRSEIISLRQDKSIRSSLDPAFTSLLNNPKLHPGNPVHNCILSLL